MPLAESLRDCLERVRPLWHENIRKDLLAGHDVLVVAHGNSLRGLVKEIDGIDDSTIERVAVPNGIPLVYRFEQVNNDLQVVKGESDIISGEFLEERGLLRTALAREEKRRSGEEEEAQVAGEAELTPLERSLATLESRRRVFADLAGSEDEPEPSPGKADAVLASRRKRRHRRHLRKALPGEPAPPPLLVIIRHGKTTHNKLGLFTGWEDAQLAPEGRAEAAAAGALMRAHGVEVDVVYTSWLTRAIETAWLVLSPLDALWVTIHKSWRLNERMYGRLTGLSKRMIKQKHGDDQFMKWRRGYRERPPPASPFSPFYPGNDERYQKYVSDVPISLRQSLIRSLGHGRLELHRKFPRAESLKDCMDRTIPYYQNTIYPQTIAKNRTVLIASSENAIRGLLMHLCDIPIANISNVEIPTGVPLIYDIAGRCVHLFDDGQLPKPRDRYDFGEAADLLFRPCDYDDDDGCDLLDPHLYLDDKFHRGDGGLGPDIEAAAEREAWERVLEIGEDDEFTTEERDFWVKEIREGATEFDDEPVEVEI